MAEAEKLVEGAATTATTVEAVGDVVVVVETASVKEQE